MSNLAEQPARTHGWRRKMARYPGTIQLITHLPVLVTPQRASSFTRVRSVYQITTSLGWDLRKLMAPDHFVLCSLLQNGNSTPYTDIRSLVSWVGSDICASYTEKKRHPLGGGHQSPQRMEKGRQLHCRKRESKIRDSR